MLRDKRYTVLRRGAPSFEYVEETKTALAKFIGLSSNWYWALLPNIIFSMKAGGYFKIPRPSLAIQISRADAFSWKYRIFYYAAVKTGISSIWGTRMSFRGILKAETNGRYSETHLI